MNQPCEGILLVDKDKGCTSFDVVAKVRRALGVKSVGHTGTLDPFATGLLVVMVGRYTRLCDHLTAQTKTYEARVLFGQSTTTDDLEGEVLETGDPSEIDEATLKSQIATFLGDQLQTPPQFSAISIGGERAYKKARRGEEIELPPRPITIYDISLKAFERPCADIVVTCSKGTYIRAIARDLGRKLGVPAHLTELRRLASGSYSVADALPQAMLHEPGRTLQALKAGASAVLGLEKVAVDENIAKMLRQGKHPPLHDGEAPVGIALAHLRGEPIALVRVVEGKLVSVRGF
jgi:tRNA pseudouridine55 synthase